MNKKNELQKVSEEIMRYMRGNYVLDEVGNGKDELKFCKGGKTVLTIYIREDHYDFLIIFGKAERELFEERCSEFPQKIQEIYHKSKTHHDCKWMLISADDLHTLEAVKQLVFIKKNLTENHFRKNRRFMPVADTAAICVCIIRAEQ